MEELISKVDARRMIRLLADTVAEPGDHAQKKQYLMQGLCDLVGAGAWAWTLGCDFKEGGGQTCVSFLHGGFDESRFARYLQALEDKEASEIAWPFFGKLATGEVKGHLTMTRQETDPDDVSSQGRVGKLWEAADIGPLVLSGRALDEDSMSLIGVYRCIGERPFNEREKTIIDLILSEVSWLHEIGWPDDRGANIPHLSPRQRVTLNLLLEGLARKQIAYELEISENTVSGYVKEVYRHFGVHSHNELLSRFRSGRALG